MRPSSVVAVVIAGIVACGPGHVEMRGASYLAGAEPSVPRDGAAATFPLPTAGVAVGASLTNGWPVWVVRHDDGTATVVSGVAPPAASSAWATASARGFFQHEAWLVRWIPGVRRFIANNLVYDERGHVLGYAAFDACFDECPRIADFPREQRDLNTLDARVVDDMIRAGAIHDGTMRPVATDWVPWLRVERADRQSDGDAARRPPVPAIAVAAAAALPPGSYAIVDGDRHVPAAP